MTENQLHHARISPTAKLVAYYREFSDIEFAKDVSDLIDAKVVTESLFSGSSLTLQDMMWMAPMLEVRYKSLAEAIKREGVRQVIEFASGVSLRGLSMTRRDPSLLYIETDLPELNAEKKLLVEEIKKRNKISLPANWHCLTANALHESEIDVLSQVLRPGEPIAIVNEGLLPYLSVAEKRIMGENVSRLLKRFGGVWITPDFASKDMQRARVTQSKNVAEGWNILARATGRDLVASAFETQDDLMAYFDELGFRAESMPMLDGSFHVSTAQLVPELAKDASKRAESLLRMWYVRLK